MRCWICGCYFIQGAYTVCGNQGHARLEHAYAGPWPAYATLDAAHYDATYPFTFATEADALAFIHHLEP